MIRIDVSTCFSLQVVHRLGADVGAASVEVRQILMVGMRWPVDFSWTRGQSRLNGREGVPLEAAGVLGSSRHLIETDVR